ncbi:MAG: DUF885 domain-containing protein, partial [Planctomycetota bacterium]
KRTGENGITWFELGSHLMPITQMGGFHTYFPQLPERITFRTVKDYENYIARLNAFKNYTAGYIELMQEGIERGLVVPKVVMKDVCSSIEPHIVKDANESLLFEPFEKFTENVNEPEQQRLIQAGRKAIEESIVPSYREFLEFIKEEYIPACRETIAASDLPNGRAFYRHCVRIHTTLDVKPEQVHNTGLSEVKRIKAEMMEIIKEVGFKGDFKEFVEFLRTDRRFYADEPNELLKEMAFIAKKTDGKLPQFFKKLPRMPFGFKEVPDYIAHDTPAAYYMRAPGNGNKAAFYYINTYDLESRPLYRMQALSMHESMPGHHLQIALQQEIEDVPEFRRFTGFTAYAEGWALYAEKLGLDMGFYEDAYSNFGRLDMEMWRACRLVVDTGIHYFGWSREKAINFMAENTSFGRDNIETEIDRYIVWPGQALAYKIGELKILELRKLAKNKLGENFDIREFHDVILRNGSIPLKVLEDNVKAWLSEKGVLPLAK